MDKDKHIYGEINNKTDLSKVMSEIREQVNDAKSRPALTEYYRRAGYLVTLSYAPSWEKKFGDNIKEIRQTAEEEFEKTAQAINRQAKKVGTDADYDETWGKES